MSAAEIIEQIKALPPDEQSRVAEFLRETWNEAAGENGTPLLRQERFSQAADKVFSEHRELLQKLAQ